MTTIAFDGKTIAADRRVTRKDYICQRGMKKIFRLPNKHIVGICGIF